MGRQRVANREKQRKRRKKRREAKAAGTSTRRYDDVTSYEHCACLPSQTERQDAIREQDCAQKDRAGAGAETGNTTNAAHGGTNIEEAAADAEAKATTSTTTAASSKPMSKIERMRMKKQQRKEVRRAKKAAKCGSVNMAASILLAWMFFFVALSTKVEAMNTHRHRCRRDILRAAATFTSVGGASLLDGFNIAANAADSTVQDNRQAYTQRFPTLFDPIYGKASRKTTKKQIGPNMWSLEQNLQLGPLQTPLRCVTIKLEDGGLWVHAPLAPTAEFFDLVESCGDGSSSAVKHVIVPSYALEHKIFVKDAMMRWPNAQLWASPGQFSFPVRSVPEDFVFGKNIDGLFLQSDENAQNDIPWTNEIQFETLAAGTFNLSGKPTTFYETAFFHKSSKSLIVTDSVAMIGQTVPELNDPELLLLVSKRSTADPQPEDTPENRLIGWEKTSLLVSYFFPEHEEPDANKFGVVTWTEGWQDNFDALSGRLLVPPVVRTLIYAQNPSRVREWVDRVSDRWYFEQIVPAHFEAPIKASPKEFQRAFAFLEDESIDAFPANDLARGLKPISDIALRR